MMMEQPAASGLMNLILLNGGFAIFALAFVLRDILWLRLVTIAGYVLFLAFALRAPDGPNWTLLFWYGLFMAINLGHSAWLIYERSQLRFSEEEAQLRDLAFKALEPLAVKRLLKLGRWRDIAAGEAIVEQDQVPGALHLLSAGRAAVLWRGRPVAEVEAGRFVGEISYLSQGAAGATVEAREAVRCLSWEREKLRRRLAKDPGLRAVLYAAFGSDLSHKIAAHNLSVSEKAG